MILIKELIIININDINNSNIRYEYNNSKK